MFLIIKKVVTHMTTKEGGGHKKNPSNPQSPFSSLTLLDLQDWRKKLHGFITVQGEVPKELLLSREFQ